MEYTTLGSTGIEVSRICLGCMSFGDPDWREWVRGEEFGHELVERALDLGINFFDTANMYSRGESERVLGDALEGRREESVVATKVFFRMDDDDPNSGGLSRKTVEQELDASLDRLGRAPWSWGRRRPSGRTPWWRRRSPRGGPPGRRPGYVRSRRGSTCSRCRRS